MRDYWEGYMNWPRDPDWTCEICGKNAGLTWGLAHAECRCNLCHAVYTMRDWTQDGDPIVTTPICRIKPEYREAAVKIWKDLAKPLDEVSESVWDQYLHPRREYDV
jgi:hypothetical protein